MLVIDGNDIFLCSGESALIEFQIDPIDQGDLTDNITGYVDIVEAPFNPCYCYDYTQKGNIKSFKLIRINNSRKFVLYLKTSETKNLNRAYFYQLRLTDGVNAVIPLCNNRLIVRRLGGNGTCSGVYSTY